MRGKPIRAVGPGIYPRPTANSINAGFSPCGVLSRLLTGNQAFFRSLLSLAPKAPLIETWNYCARRALCSCLLFDLRPRILQRQRAVEDQFLRRRIRVQAEVADALELEAVFEFGVGERGL
jgi:hypothetical protein